MFQRTFPTQKITLIQHLASQNSGNEEYDKGESALSTTEGLTKKVLKTADIGVRIYIFKAFVTSFMFLQKEPHREICKNSGISFIHIQNETANFNLQLCMNF